MSGRAAWTGRAGPWRTVGAGAQATGVLIRRWREQGGDASLTYTRPVEQARKEPAPAAAAAPAVMHAVAAHVYR